MAAENPADGSCYLPLLGLQFHRLLVIPLDKMIGCPLERLVQVAEITGVGTTTQFLVSHSG